MVRVIVAHTKTDVEHKSPAFGLVSELGNYLVNTLDEASKFDESHKDELDYWLEYFRNSFETHDFVTTGVDESVLKKPIRRLFTGRLTDEQRRMVEGV